MTVVTLTWDETPPSANENKGVGGRGNPATVSRTKKQWEGIFGFLLMQAGVPRNLTSVEVKCKLQFRTKVRRDGDNFMMPVSKPLGDVLVSGGWLPDDTPEHYNMERIRIETGADLPARIKGRTVLEVDYSTEVR